MITFTQEGKSALIIASEKGHELVMFVLLDSNADVNFKLEVCIYTHDITITKCTYKLSSV